MRTQYRFYSFVAGLYLSPLQRGLQTGHAVSEMHADLLKTDIFRSIPEPSEEREAYDSWAENDKVIVILDVLNHAGVVEAYNTLSRHANNFDLPVTIFYEDMQSLNNAATAAGVVVPDRFFNVRHVVKPAGFLKTLFGGTEKKLYRYESKAEDGTVIRTAEYLQGTPEYEFCSFLKSYKLAQS